MLHHVEILGGKQPSKDLRVILGKVFNSYHVKYTGNVCPKIGDECPAVLIVSDVLSILFLAQRGVFFFNEGRHIFNLRAHELLSLKPCLSYLRTHTQKHTIRKPKSYESDVLDENMMKCVPVSRVTVFQKHHFFLALLFLLSFRQVSHFLPGS